MHLQENSIFDLDLGVISCDLDLGVKVTRNVAQYPLHSVTISATSYGLGGDTFTRNMTDGRTGGRTDGRTTDRL